jgi:hypothetical protein
VASGAGEVAPAVPLTPAVSIKKSITPDYLTCLEDGRKFKSLKRHLRAKYDLSPEAYRARWACQRTIRWWRQTTLWRARAGQADGFGTRRPSGHEGAAQGGRSRSRESLESSRRALAHLRFAWFLPPSGGGRTTWAGSTG